MNGLDSLRGGLFVLWGLAASCGGSPAKDPGQQGQGSATPPADQKTGAELVADLTNHMERLRALQLFNVGELVVNLAEAPACYGGNPCAGAESDPAVAAEYARQAPRLA